MSRVVVVGVSVVYSSSKESKESEESIVEYSRVCSKRELADYTSIRQVST